jgi:hypothetical protein
MKRLIESVLALSTLATSVIAISSCSSPAAVSLAIDSPVRSANPRPATTFTVAPTMEERLEEMQSSLQTLINQNLASGQPVPEYLYEQTQSLQNARRLLSELDGQRIGLQTLIGQQMASGDIVPECEYEDFRTAERSRQQLLETFGLAD